MAVRGSGDLKQCPPTTGHPLFLGLLDLHGIPYPRNGLHSDAATRPASVSRGAELFGLLQVIPLTIQERAQSCEFQKVMVEMLQRGAFVMDATTQHEFLQNQLTIEDVRRDPTWLDEGIVLVTTNGERHALTVPLLISWAKRNNQRILAWPKTFVGDKFKALSDEQKQAIRDHCPSAWEYFCPGLPSVICQTIKISCGLANGTVAKMVSFQFAGEVSKADRAEIRRRLAEEPAGSIIKVDIPPQFVHCAVHMPEAAFDSYPEHWAVAKFPDEGEHADGGTVVFPVGKSDECETLGVLPDLETGVCGVSVQFQPLRVQPRLVSTIDKAQGLSINRVILALNEIPTNLMTYSKLYVAISRATAFQNLRILPVLPGAEHPLQWLAVLKPHVGLELYETGVDQHGFFSADLCRPLAEQSEDARQAAKQAYRERMSVQRKAANDTWRQSKTQQNPTALAAPTSTRTTGAKRKTFQDLPPKLAADEQDALEYKRKQAALRRAAETAELALQRRELAAASEVVRREATVARFEQLVSEAEARAVGYLESGCTRPERNARAEDRVRIATLPLVSTCLRHLVHGPNEPSSPGVLRTPQWGCGNTQNTCPVDASLLGFSAVLSTTPEVFRLVEGLANGRLSEHVQSTAPVQQVRSVALAQMLLRSHRLILDGKLVAARLVIAKQLLTDRSIRPPHAYQKTNLYGSIMMFWTLVEQMDLSMCAAKRTYSVQCSDGTCVRNGTPAQSFLELQNFRLAPKNAQQPAQARNVLAPLTVELNAKQTPFPTCQAAYARQFQIADADAAMQFDNFCNGPASIMRQTSRMPLVLALELQIDINTRREQRYTVFDFPHIYQPIPNGFIYRLQYFILSNMENHFTNVVNVANGDAQVADLIYIDNMLPTRAIPIDRAGNHFDIYFPIFVLYVRIQS